MFHDTDLRRIMGDNRRVWQVTFSEMRELDAGSWFGEEFAGERVISLQEAIETVGDKLDLIIEMKYHGQERNLEKSVIEAIRESQIGDRCKVISLELQGVHEIARRDPQLSRGIIVTAGIGDPTRLDVDAVAINAQQVTRDLIARAHRADTKVHVWTVNDQDTMRRLHRPMRCAW